MRRTVVTCAYYTKSYKVYLGGHCIVHILGWHNNTVFPISLPAAVKSLPALSIEMAETVSTV